MSHFLSNESHPLSSLFVSSSLSLPPCRFPPSLSSIESEILNFYVFVTIWFNNEILDFESEILNWEILKMQWELITVK